MEYQWYPGHMTKARRMMEENIRLVDLVIELVDARIPLSSRNPDIDALCEGKGRIVLLCKSDLADPVKTEQFVEFFREKGILAVAADARERRAADLVRRFVQDACSEKIARDRARGIVGRPLRAMVAGIPNVGKSTFINSFAGRASTKTGNKPGVTRGKQWIRMGGSVELLDTPGILWPKFDNQEIGMRLALVGAIRNEILDREELAVWLLNYLEKEYPGVIQNKYLSADARSGEEAEQSSVSPDAGALEEAPEETVYETANDPAETEEARADQEDEDSTQDPAYGSAELEEAGADQEDEDSAEGPAYGSAELEEAGADQEDEDAAEHTVVLASQAHETLGDEAYRSAFELLKEIARSRRLLMRGAEPDTGRAAAMLLDDCKNGRIGRVSLDRPDDAEAMEEERRKLLEESAAKEASAGRSSRSTGSGKGGRNPGAGSRSGNAGSRSGNAGGRSAGAGSRGGSKNSGTGYRGAENGNRSGNTGSSGSRGTGGRNRSSDSGSPSRSRGSKKPGGSQGRGRGQSGRGGSADRRSGGKRR